MNRQEKFVNTLVTLYLNGESTTFSNGQSGYRFPCPFCSSYYSSQKTSKKNERCAKFSLDKRWKSYNFFCHRKKSPDCSNTNNVTGGLSFKTFLKRYNPDLYRQYMNLSDFPDFDFKPKFKK